MDSSPVCHLQAGGSNLPLITSLLELQTLDCFIVLPMHEVYVGVVERLYLS